MVTNSFLFPRRLKKCILILPIYIRVYNIPGCMLANPIFIVCRKKNVKSEKSFTPNKQVRERL